MLLEAVPNLQLGPEDPARDAVLEVLEARASPGWALLDVHSDGDHRRTVLTLAGAPSPLAGALTTLVDAAVEHGDLGGGQGVHPRIGLIDVVPIVPLVGARWQDAARLATTAGHHLAGHGIPVHTYGRIASRPEHRVLAPIRRAYRQGTPPPPAMGPGEPHPRLGAACVGVRGLLVAYNVLLDTRDRALGAQVARGVRESSGGLAGVQALAFPLASQGGRLQVSCNLTDPQATGPAQLFQRVTELAEAEGVDVLGGELVGLAPRACLPDQPARMGLASPPRSLEAELGAAGLPETLEAPETA